MILGLSAVLLLEHPVLVFRETAGVRNRAGGAAQVGAT